MVPVPNVLGRSQSQATRMMELAGLGVGRVSYVRSTGTPDRVSAQSGTGTTQPRGWLMGLTVTVAADTDSPPIPPGPPCPGGGVASAVKCN
jgi:beta-lactam-binding protein with PASTA domain